MADTYSTFAMTNKDDSVTVFRKKDYYDPHGRLLCPFTVTFDIPISDEAMKRMLLWLSSIRDTEKMKGIERA